MKKNKGVTLISLVVTVLVLLLLSSVMINVSMDVYNNVKIENFIAKAKIVQAKVDNIAQEGNLEDFEFTKLSDIDNQEDKSFFTDMIENPDIYNIDTGVSWHSEADSNIENYYYFKNSDFEKIGLKNQDIVAVINFKTRNVIIKDGIEKDGETYYRQYDLANGDKNITSSNFAIIPDGLEIGSLVSYTPSGTYDEWTTAHSGFDTSYKLASGSAYTGASGQTNMTISSWKVFKIDEKTGEVQLVPENPTEATVGLKGADGYNNAVKLLNDACSSLYGNGSTVKARSINIDDIESVLDYDPTTFVQTNANSESVNYGGQKSSAYQTNKKYPEIYAQEIKSVITPVPEGKSKTLGLSDSTRDWLTGTATAGTSIHPYQTFYILNYDEFKLKLKESYASLLLPNTYSTQYWLASRCIQLDTGLCNFLVRIMSSGGLSANRMDNSAGNTNHITRSLFPLLSLNIELIEGDNTSGWSIKKSEVEQAIDRGTALTTTENTTLTDVYGNKVVVPAGFKVTNDATTVNNGIVIEDVTNQATRGSQFVWVPVPKNGYVYGASGAINDTKIILDRYIFDANGEPIGQGENPIKGTADAVYCTEYSGDVDADLRPAKDIQGFRDSVSKNEGYYIGRYEARTSVQRTGRTETLPQVTTKGDGYIYNFVIQRESAELSRNMYTSSVLDSDLINGYAWDTAILFMQELGKDSNYSLKTSINDVFTSKGTNNQETNDVQCNIYDMASNVHEFTTEIGKSSIYHMAFRGGLIGYPDRNASFRGHGSINSNAEILSFRPILYLK